MVTRLYASSTDRFSTIFMYFDRGGLREGYTGTGELPLKTRSSRRHIYEFTGVNNVETITLTAKVADAATAGDQMFC